MSDKKVVEKEKSKSQFVEMDTVTTNDMVIIVNGKKDRSYRFTMEFNSPLSECYDAALNVANELARHFNEAIAKQKEAAEKKELEEKVAPKSATS